MKVRFETLPPPPELADVVRFYWVFEIEGIHERPYIYRSMADGCAELVFHYRSRFAEIVGATRHPETTSSVHAQTAIHRRFEVTRDFGMFGAYLYPYALPRLFGTSAAHFSDTMPDLPSVLGVQGSDLEERILTAPDHHHRVALLSQFLFRRLDRGKRGNQYAQKAVNIMVKREGQLSVTALAAEMGLSMRQLERLFKDYAGFSPKTYARILRFQSAAREYGNSRKSLTAIALDCGYYDQAHFIHDFKQFSGYTPGEYFLGRPEGIEFREV